MEVQSDEEFLRMKQYEQRNQTPGQRFSTYNDEVHVKLDNDVNIGSDVNFNEAEQLDLSIGKDVDDSVNSGSDISCGGRRG